MKTTLQAASAKATNKIAVIHRTFSIRHIKNLIASNFFAINSVVDSGRFLVDVTKM